VEQEDLLLTLAQIAVTLTALSGVAGILRPRSGEARMTPIEILLLRNVALIGLVVAAFALLPLTFRGSAFSHLAIWRACSALAVACWIAAYGIFLRQALAPLRSGGFSVQVFSLGLAFNVIGIALLAWNLVSPDSASAQRYALGLLCALALAGINFIVTALRPGPPADGS